jgi:hypothetical protein
MSRQAFPKIEEEDLGIQKYEKKDYSEGMRLEMPAAISGFF